MFLFQTKRNADTQYRLIMSNIQDLDAKIAELITAQKAESTRVAAAQAKAQAALDDLSAKLAAALAAGATTVDTSAEIASVQSAIDALNATDPAPVAPVEPAPAQ